MKKTYSWFIYLSQFSFFKVILAIEEEEHYERHAITEIIARSTASLKIISFKSSKQNEDKPCLQNVIEKLKRLKIVDIININEDNYKQTNENDMKMVDYIMLYMCI